MPAELFKEGFQALVVYDIHVGPVVQAGPFQAFIVCFETQGMDKVKGGGSGGTESCDISSVGRYLWFNQDDIKAVHQTNAFPCHDTQNTGP